MFGSIHQWCCLVGHFFVGRFLITDLISLLSGLFRFSNSSYFSLDRFMFLGINPVFSRLSHYNCSCGLLWFLYYCGVRCNVSSLIYNFICIFSVFFLVNLAKGQQWILLVFLMFANLVNKHLLFWLCLSVYCEFGMFSFPACCLFYEEVTLYSLTSF